MSEDLDGKIGRIGQALQPDDEPAITASTGRRIQMKIEYISSDGIHRAEKLALEKMREAFNASAFSQHWHGFAGFEIIDRETRDREIDLVLLTHDRLVVIELKDWRGTVTAVGDQWYLNGDFRGRSPVKVTSSKARLLASRLKKRLRGSARNASVDYLVVFSAAANLSGVPTDERPLVITLDDFLRFSGQGTYGKFFHTVPGTYSPCEDLNTFRLLFRGNDFRPTVYSFHNYRITGDPLFCHPGGLYSEFKAIKKDDANYQALLRRWDFTSMTGRADTIEERARVALREHKVIGYVREQNEALEPCLPAPLWSPTEDDVQVDFCELYRLPARQSRLSEFINKYGAQLAPSDRLALVKVLLSHFAGLHDINVAHRDIGDHSVWLEPPTKVSLSSFVTAYFPETLTVGELRGTLRASNVSIPEDVAGLGDGVKSDPFRRDVYMLGVVAHYLLFLKWPNRDGTLKIFSWDPTLVENPFTDELGSWIATALELVPADRYANAREMLNALNGIACQAGEMRPVSLAEFSPFESDTLPIEIYPVDKTLKAGRTHIYTSSLGGAKVLVKIWYGLQPDPKAPEKSHTLLAFLERCKRLKEQRPESLPGIHDFGLSPAGAFVVQAFVEGTALDEVMKAGLQPTLTLQTCRALIDALQRLHGLGYAHGDISPRNIVINNDTVAFIDVVDAAVDGQRVTPAYAPPNYADVPLEQLDCYALTVICRELITRVSGGWDGLDVTAVCREIDACLNREFQVFRLDRISDELTKALTPPAKQPLGATVIVGLRHQATPETLAADNGTLHVGVFEDTRRDGAAVVSVFGVRAEVSISFNPDTNQIISIRLARFEHSGFVWRLKKAKAVLQNVTVELRAGTVDLGAELLATALANPEVARAVKEVRARGTVEETAPQLPSPAVVERPSSREIWKALIRAEEETLPEVEISGPIERDHLSGAIKIPYSTKGESLDFDPEDAIEVLHEVDGEWRKVGELNTRETSLTTLVIERPFRVPHRLGVVLKLRSQQDRASFFRRRSAVERVANEESVIPNLLQFFDPTAAPAPVVFGEEPTDAELETYTLYTGARLVFSLNAQQREAFRRLWTTGPVGLLQGPPGTGKTAFIASFVHHAISKGAQSVLLASQSHEAVNNAAEKIVDLCRRTELPLRLVRFGAEGMVSDALRRYHSSAVIQAYRDLAVAELRARVISLSSNLGLPADFVAVMVDLDHHLGGFVRHVDRMEKRRKALPEQSADARRLGNRIRQAEEMCAAVAADKFGLTQSAGPKADLDALERRAAVEHEIRSPDLIGRLRSVIAVAREWIHRLGADRANFEEFLAKTRTLVCGTCVGLGRSQFGIPKNEYDWVIVDEAARATPSELAVAIQSGRRILLVGDHRQLPPLYKDEVIEHLVGTSQFGSRDYLTRSDFQRCFESGYGVQAGAMLKVQYRMAPEIGALVSECFYPERLEPGRSGPPAWFAGAPEPLQAIITWIDTSTAGKDGRDRQPRGSNSYENPYEARVVLDLLKAIVRDEAFLTALANDSVGDERPIGVICMYTDQRRLLQKLFDEQDWSSQLRRLVKIDTVDSYQGKQNRLIILSNTRNNSQEIQGHVSIAERVNVSISRAMDRLVIVGAARMWRGKNQDSPMARVLSFIESHNDGERFTVIAAGKRSGGTL